MARVFPFLPCNFTPSAYVRQNRKSLSVLQKGVVRTHEHHERISSERMSEWFLLIKSSPSHIEKILRSRIIVYTYQSSFRFMQNAIFTLRFSNSAYRSNIPSRR